MKSRSRLRVAASTTTGITGRVDAESGGGSIRFDDIGGAVNAETGGRQH